MNQRKVNFRVVIPNQYYQEKAEVHQVRYDDKRRNQHRFVNILLGEAITLNSPMKISLLLYSAECIAVRKKHYFVS